MRGVRVLGMRFFIYVVYIIFILVIRGEVYFGVNLKLFREVVNKLKRVIFFFFLIMLWSINKFER